MCIRLQLGLSLWLHFEVALRVLFAQVTRCIQCWMYLGLVRLIVNCVRANMGQWLI